MRNLLLSTVSLFVVPAVAIAAPDFISHTHTTPIELKPISHSFGLKTAAICFLGVGDCDPNAGFGKGDENYTLDTSAQCKNEGFVANNCNSVQTPTGYCPYNKSYVSGCKCASNLITCPAGQVGVGDSCNGQYASCQCDPALISCPSNKNGQGASCGGKYQSCVCKSEYIYTSSNCTSPRSLSGSSCDGKYTGCSCPTGVSSGSYGCETYYPSPCSSVCKKAYTDNCHNRSDNNSAVYGCMKYWSDCSSKCETPYTDNCRNRTNQSCSYGCQTYWSDCSSKCQTCYSDNCRNRNAVISSCPANATCSYFSDCTSKISSWSCNSGYVKSGNSCINPCDNRTNQSCSYGCQTYWSDCSSKCQTCYSDNCRNRNAVSIPTNAHCSSYYSDCSSKCSAWACNDGYQSSGNSCVTTCTAANCKKCRSISSTQCEVCESGYTLVSGWVCKKSSCTNTCTYSLSSCPPNGVCYSCTTTNSDCSTGTTRYSLVSCKSGYIDFSGTKCTGCGITQCENNCYMKGKPLDVCQRECRTDSCAY